MRKTGLIFTLLGGSLGILLFFVRKTAWYVSAASYRLSELAEFVESAFWASILTLGLGLLLLLLSLRHRKELPQVYEDSADGDGDVYPEEAYDGYVPDPAMFADTEQRTFKDPWIPDPPEPEWIPGNGAGEDREAAQEDWICNICGCRNPAFSNICAVCGSFRGNRI